MDAAENGDDPGIGCLDPGRHIAASEETGGRRREADDLRLGTKDGVDIFFDAPRGAILLAMAATSFFPSIQFEPVG